LEKSGLQDVGRDQHSLNLAIITSVMPSDLSSSINSNRGQERLERILVFGFIGIYILLNLAYLFSETSTWDDDCPTRYYNTLNALSDPIQFISLWNRPLFVLLFFLPVHLGKYAIGVGMILITAIAGHFLYKGVKKVGMQNAWLILPFFFFQTFFFTISRNAETEPLAVALICLGFYFLTHRKWLYFAITGSLMPLARLELSVLLIFWVYELIVNKQYKYLPILVIPAFCWNIAGGLLKGDYLYLFNQTLGGETEANRYGHTSFGHYFRRYIYVTGPVIYPFLLAGLVSKIKKRDFDPYLFIQFVAGFLLYVIFSWKLNMGNPAGFLRNLVPLTPLAALLALEGFNYIMNAITTRTSSLEKNSNDRNILLILALFILIALTAYIFHANKLEMHHILSDKKNYLNLLVVLAVLFFFTGIYFSLRKKAMKSIPVLIPGLALSLGMMSFTLVTEKPDANSNPERKTIQAVSDLYSESYLKDLPTYANHIWFYWVNDLDRSDPKFHPVTLSELNAARKGSICIFENHYSFRLAGNVQPYYFSGNKSWIELTRRISDNLGFACIVYQKMDTLDMRSNLSYFDTYLRTYPQDLFALVARGNYKVFYLADYEGGMNDFQAVLNVSPNFYMALYNRGVACFYLGRFELALADFKKSVRENPYIADAYISLGLVQARMMQYDSAIASFSSAIALDDAMPEAYLNRGLALTQVKRYNVAINDFSKVLKLDKWNVGALENRSQINFQTQNWAASLEDIDQLLRIQPQNGMYWYNKGMCEQYLKKNQEACRSWQIAFQLGISRAAEKLRAFCN
jgi:tetratricopeptide (TPR) repeat protein